MKRAFLVFCVHGTDPIAWRSIADSHSLIPGGLHGNRVAVHFAVSLLGDHGRIVSEFRTNSSIYIFFDLRQWLTDGRAAYRSANNVICVHETIPLTYIYSVIDRTYNKELLAEHEWNRLQQAVQANRLQVTSDGRWLADPAAIEQITAHPTRYSEIDIA